MSKVIYAPIVMLALAVAGCRESGPRASGYLAVPGPQRIRAAVIPFDSASLQFENAGQVIGQEVVTALMETGMFDVVDPGAVYQAMVDAGLRNANGYGMGPSGLERLQEKMGPVRIFVVGMVQEFGEVRIGPASYPSISINARVLDARNGSILWSGSVSRTGSDTEKFFGLGAVHSPGRLARGAVRELIGSVNRRELARILQASAEGPPPMEAAHVVPASRVRLTGKERFFDEKASYSEADMRSLMVEVGGLSRSGVGYREHHYSIAEATYRGSGFEVHAKLVDYRKAESALGFVRHEHPDEAEVQFAGLPAFSAPSAADMPGGYHLDLAAGRFGIFLRGPSQRQEDMERVARALIAAMK